MILYASHKLLGGTVPPRFLHPGHWSHLPYGQDAPAYDMPFYGIYVFKI